MPNLPVLFESSRTIDPVAEGVDIVNQRCFPDRRGVEWSTLTVHDTQLTAVAAAIVAAIAALFHLAIVDFVVLVAENEVITNV